MQIILCSGVFWGLGNFLYFHHGKNRKTCFCHLCVSTSGLRKFAPPYEIRHWYEIRHGIRHLIGGGGKLLLIYSLNYALLLISKIVYANNFMQWRILGDCAIFCIFTTGKNRKTCFATFLWALVACENFPPPPPMKYATDFMWDFDCTKGYIL